MASWPLITRRTRAKVEAIIEQLVELLDTLDGDEDLEDAGEYEPSLGGTTLWLHGRVIVDAEQDNADLEYSIGVDSPEAMMSEWSDRHPVQLALA